MNRQLPWARNQEIILQELNNELLIYDLQTNTAYTLNQTSKIVYQACDGNTKFDELKRTYQFTDDLIFFTLNELNKKNLLENYSAANFAGLTRREVIQKVGLGSFVALPLITSVVAPTAVNAQSGGLLPNGAACTSGGQCASNNCSGTKNTCCNRLPGGISDLAPCTTTTDCCLSTTTSRCQGGVCCRNTGINCQNGAVFNDNICCSGVCSRTNGQCT